MIAGVFRAHGERIRLEYNDRMTLAWHIANLTRREKMPQLEKLLLKESGVVAAKAQRKQTMEQQLNIVRAMNKALGGKRKVMRKTDGS